jgi:hypothetical protein
MHAWWVVLIHYTHSVLFALINMKNALCCTVYHTCNIGFYPEEAYVYICSSTSLTYSVKGCNFLAQISCV